MPDPAVTLREVAGLDALPPAARALFGQDMFSTWGWYRATLAAGLPAAARPAFQLAEAAGEILAVLPMLRQGAILGALATPYTCLWQPLLAPGLTEERLNAVGQALGRAWRRQGVVRLEAMASDDAGQAGLLAGLRQAGLHLLAFDHFGNWHEAVAGQGWEVYLAARPRRLRTAIARQTRRLCGQPGFAFTLVQDEAGLEGAIAAYETVYAASWKQAEPHAGFNPALMRECARSGTLRLGIVWLSDVPIAAQLWAVHEGWAGVLKLAYDEAHKAWAPGNVLTGLMIRHLLEHDRIAEIDFGRGDDEYKQGWARTRRQRVGVLVADPWRASGAWEVLRHLAGRTRKTGLVFWRGRFGSRGQDPTGS